MTHKDLGVQLDGAVIHVLAPEEDIDGYYLGKVDGGLKGLQEVAGVFRKASNGGGGAAPKNSRGLDRPSRRRQGAPVATIPG